MAAARNVGAPDAEALHRLDPDYGLSPAPALGLRQKRLTAVEALIGSRSDLLLQPYYALAAAAEAAGARDVAVVARLRIDDVLAARRGRDVAVERSIC